MEKRARREIYIDIASERLLKWSQAFEDWLKECYLSKGGKKNASVAWHRLLKERGKVPWTFTKVDIETFMRWMKAEGYAAVTTYHSLGYFQKFYQYCSQHHIDPLCDPGFNPAAGIDRQKQKDYEKVSLFSRMELEALFGVLKNDQTLLGKRDYAFILARLRLGIHLRCLQRLQWKQFEQAENNVKVSWSAEFESMILPQEVWKAIHEYLADSGRLEGIQGEEYIFAPLFSTVSTSDVRREDWDARRYISNGILLHIIKTAGRAVFIDEEKLTMQVLLDTALRLKLDEGADMDEMHAFTCSRSSATSLRHRLKHLPPIPEDQWIDIESNLNKVSRKPKCLIGLLKKRASGGSALADYVWETWEESKMIWLESKGWGGDDPINNPQPPVIYVDGEGGLKTSFALKTSLGD